MSSDKSNAPGASAKDAELLPPDPVIEYYKKQIDRDLLRANLKLTVNQRFDYFQILNSFAEQLALRLEFILGLPHRPLEDSSY